jgi:hypothetical protein
MFGGRVEPSYRYYQWKGHVMNDITLKAQEERQGWTRLSDIAWTAGYLIAARASVDKRSGVSPAGRSTSNRGTEFMRAAPH